MKKWAIALIIIGAVIVALALAAYFALFASTIKVAFLNIESGSVEVDIGKGWQAADDGMSLKLSDKVKTGDKAEAVIILHESVIISLEANTEILIQDLDKEHLTIKQDSGSTWNKFTGLSGVKSYEVQTPETVVTVRATEFGVDMTGVIVGEGEVDVRAQEKIFKIRQDRKLIKREGRFIEETQSDKERELVIARMKKTLVRMKDLRKQEIRKKSLIYNRIKKSTGLTNEDVDEYMEKIDKGEINETELLEKSPIQTKSLKRSVEITQKIKKQHRAIEELERTQQTQQRLVERE